MKKLAISQRKSAGFTLVELLVVVLIITILATVSLFAMAGAMESGRLARTRAQVAKINNLLAPQWESYRTRRAPINIPAGTDPRTAAGARLDAIRELMRMEMPDRKSDVTDGPKTGIQRPAKSAAYLARATAGWTTDHQGAECLYLIMAMMQDGDQSALEFFREAEIGDIDNDGMPEILDGWGTPIRLLRWAPGFITQSTLQDGNSPDAFDPLGVRGTPSGSPKSYYLYPLVISAGPDREWDIAFDGTTALSYADTSPPNDPYTLSCKLGMAEDNNSNGAIEHIDNIHNHLSDVGIK